MLPRYQSKPFTLLVILILIGILVFMYRSDIIPAFIVYSVLCGILFIYLGFGLTALFCPKSVRASIFFLSPMVGYCYLTIVGWFFYNLGFKGTDSYYGWILVPPIIFLFVYILLGVGDLQKKINPKSSWRIFELIKCQIKKVLKKEHIAPLLLPFIAFTFLSLASITESSLTSISMGNNDIAAYSLNSRILKELSKSELVGFAEQYGEPLHRISVFGVYLSSAFFSSIFGLETYQSQNIITNVFFVFSMLLVYCIAYDIFRYNRFSALAVTSLYGLSPIMYYTVYQGFQAQIIATGLSLTIILLNWHIINTKRFDEIFHFFPLIFFSNWAFLLTYPHILPILYVPILVFLVLFCFYNKSLKPFYYWLTPMIPAFFIVFTISPQIAKAFVEYFFWMKDVIAGWFIPWISPETFYGFTFRNFYLSRPLSTQLRLIVSTPLVMLIAYGMVKLFHKDRKRFLFSLAIIATVTAGYILLILPGAEQQQLGGNSFGGYKHYKLLSFFLPILLITSLIIFRDLDYRARKGFKFFLLVCFIVLLTANIVSAYLMSREMERVHVSVDREVIELQKVEKEGGVGSINIPSSSSWWTIMWEHNFLLMKKLYDQQDTYYPKTKLDGEWNLVRNQERDILTVKYMRPTESIFVNSRYSLIKSSNTFFAVLGEGWYGSEVTHRWTSSNISTVIIYSNSNNTMVRLEVYFSPLDMANRLSIYLNGRIIQDYTSEQRYSIENLSLDYGENVVEFKSLMQPMLSSNGDPRRVGYSFSLIKLEQI